MPQYKVTDAAVNPGPTGSARDNVYMPDGDADNRDDDLVQAVPYPTRFPGNPGNVAAYKSLAAGRIVTNEYPDSNLTDDDINEYQNCSYL